MAKTAAEDRPLPLPLPLLLLLAEVGSWVEEGDEGLGEGGSEGAELGRGGMWQMFWIE